MTVFLLAALALVAAALVLLVPPLIAARRQRRPARAESNLAIYRAQAKELDADLANGLLAPDEHEKAKRELETRLLADIDSAGSETPPARPAVKTAVALAALIPICAVGVYLAVGTPAALDPRTLAAPNQPIDKEQLAAMVDRLAQKLKEDPENGVGWTMLARAYRYFGRYDEAAKAYAQAIPRLAPDASLLADYADALAAAQGTLEGEPRKLIARALEVDPANLKALALAGSAAFESKDFSGAERYWQKMLPLVGPGSEDAKAIEANISEARAGAGTKADARPAPSAAAAGQVTGVVQIAPALAGKVSPKDTVLIYARAAEGPRMPLAIMQREARELPIEFRLDDTMAMQPGMTLSKFERVVIVARIAKSANAKAQPGDLEGASAPVSNTSRNVTVTIDSEVR